MGDRLVVRYTVTSRTLRLLVAWTGLVIALVSLDSDPGDVALGVSIGIVLIAYAVAAITLPHVVFDIVRCRFRGLFSARETAWSAVVAVRWRFVRATKGNGPGWRPILLLRSGSSRAPYDHVSEDNRERVTAWLREHQPEIRIDPTPPWRDRFGVWHVAEPGYDPVETMMSVRRSLVGPWEIVARSYDGGFVAEQRVERTGVVVRREPVRETLAEAKADGVRLVRDAIVAASSAHE